MKKEIQETGLFKKDNMSPAARRRMINGKRRADTSQDKHFSLDMEDQLIVEALASYADDDWTESLRIKAELLEEKEREFEKNMAYRRSRERYVSEEDAVDLRSNNRRNNNRNGNRNRNENQNRRYEEEIKRRYGKDRLGIMLSNVQVLAAVIFLICLIIVNLLPYLYVALLSVAIIFSIWILRVNQSLRFKHRSVGKVCSGLCTFFMLIGAYYCIITLLLLVNISDENSSSLNLSKDTYSVYISGIDVYGDVDSSSRSDVNLIATINPTTGQILLTTTPRDYYVEIPGVSDGAGDKLTHAGNYGIETSMATLEELYGIDIDFYIRVNFTSFINIIDALGGVTVESEIAFTTSENSGLVIDIQEGENYLTGEEALAFVRERYNLDEGDAQRGVNQQIMLEAIFEEFMSPTILVNLERVLACISEDVQTNMTTAQLQQMSRGILSNILDTNIYSVAATGTSDYAYCYSYSSSALSVIIPDEDCIDEIVGYMEDVENGEELPE